MWLVSNFTSLDWTASLHTNNNIISSSLIKLEVHPDFHWPNFFATVLLEFHWQFFAMATSKYPNLTYFANWITTDGRRTFVSESRVTRNWRPLETPSPRTRWSVEDIFFTTQLSFLWCHHHHHHSHYHCLDLMITFKHFYNVALTASLVLLYVKKFQSCSKSYKILYES